MQQTEHDSSKLLRCNAFTVSVGMMLIYIFCGSFLSQVWQRKDVRLMTQVLGFADGAGGCLFP